MVSGFYYLKQTNQILFEGEVDKTLTAVITLQTQQPTLLPPTFTPSPTITRTSTPVICHDIRGRIEYREVINEFYNYPLGIRVYIPPCYDFDPNSRYPVLFILHGQSYNDDQWDRLGMDEAADRMILEGEIPPLVIVMPREPNTLADDKESKYGDFLANTLVGWIDREYRTIPSRACRAIGGLSRGAAWSMRVGFINWELFGAIGTHSFAPFSGDFYNFPYWLREIPEEEVPRVYMDMGTLDYMMNPASLFEDRLTKYHVAHEWIINRGTHNEEYWSSHVEDYLRWYTETWKKDCQD